MAAVAGAISETVGISLLSEDSLSKLWQREPDIGNPDGHRARISEVIVENGETCSSPPAVCAGLESTRARPPL